MSKKVSRVSTIMCILGLVGVTVLVSSIRRPVTAKNKLSQTQSLSDEAMQRYKMVSSFPIEDRKAFFANSSDSVRSELWRAHLLEYLRKHPELNTAQRNVIEDGISVATPELFRIGRNSGGKNEVVNSIEKVISIRAQAVFSQGEKRNIFGVLGEPTSHSKMSQRTLPNCDCSRTSNFCSGTCKWWSCTNQPNCGWFWQYTCDGLC